MDSRFSRPEGSFTPIPGRVYVGLYQRLEAENTVADTTSYPSTQEQVASRDLWYGTSGPRDAEIVIVGEAWGAEEDIAKRPFVGQSGKELRKMLAEAGIDETKVLWTNVAAMRPLNNDMWRLFIPQDTYDPLRHGEKLRGLAPSKFIRDELQCLYTQIAAHPRKLVIAVGNYALWALTDCTGSGVQREKDGRPIPPDLWTWVPTGNMTWRGSMLFAEPPMEFTVPNWKPTNLLPIVHPAAILREWSLRAVTVHDLKARVPMALRGDWRPNPLPIFWAPPTFDQAVSRLKLWLAKLEAGPLELTCDIETAKKLITVIGFTDSIHFAMAIPFIDKDKDGNLFSYWKPEQEAILLGLIGRILSHKNLLCNGQNFIYDTQYFQYFLGVTPKLHIDTMLAHHLLWPGTPKSLDYISSLYVRYYWYWKDDGKEWNLTGDLSTLLTYNCQDLVNTHECAGVLKELIPLLGQTVQWEETKERYYLALRMMKKGVRIDKEHRNRLNVQLMEALLRINGELEQIIPQSMADVVVLAAKLEAKPDYKMPKKKSSWYTSPSQQQIVFRDILGIRLPRSRKTGRDTLGKDALKELKQKYPVWTGIFDRMSAARSVSVFRSHFIEAGVDADGNMRCSYNPAGTETFRFNSSENVFGGGTNLQNLPKGDED